MKLQWPWRTRRQIEAALPIPKVSPEQWEKLNGSIQSARIVSYDEMDEESKQVWDRHMETQHRIFGK
jgi:hypothetical protein